MKLFYLSKYEGNYKQNKKWDNFSLTIVLPWFLFTDIFPRKFEGFWSTIENFKMDFEFLKGFGLNNSLEMS